ncbi:MAG: TldD/PmbA family protein [bacterium]
MDITQCAQKIKQKIKNKNKYEWEVYISQGKGAGLSWSEGSLEEKQYADDGGIGVRLLSKGRQGFASTNKIDPDEFAGIWQQAESILQFMPEDTYRMLPEPAEIHEEDLETFDREIDALDIRGKEDILSSMEKQLLRFDSRIKKSYKIEWNQGTGKSLLFNSKGVNLTREGTSCSSSVECVAEESGDTQVGAFFQSRRFMQDLDLADIPLKAAAITVDQLKGKPIPSGSMPVILEPWVMMEFIEMIASAVCADNVQKGKSLFKDRIGNAVASPLVNIIDDARLKRGIGSGLFDDEGMPTQMNAIITNGNLQSFLYDSYTARKGKTQSTGNAKRPSYRGLPEPGTSNFIMQPGETLRDAMLKNTARGLRIIHVMGMHTADPISGDFSLGAVGTLIENGVFTRPVRGITIAGNIMHMLKDIETICDDLMIIGSAGSPTVKIKQMMVGGS